VRLLLEMITRDPLPVPCLSDKYWTTLPDRSAIDLARTLRFVEGHKPVQALPRISHLSYAEQRQVEDQNVIACLKYASEALGL
jgi:hypothetical protein